MIKVGMPVVSGRWRGTVHAIKGGHVYAIKYERGLAVDFRVHPVEDVRVSKGRAVAPPANEISKARIRRSWERADP